MTFWPNKIRPVHIQLELTNRCNNNCLFCYNDGKTAEMPLERVISLFDRMQHAGVMQLTLTGGEALLHPQFREICKEACARFNTVLLTNGTLVSEEIAQFLSSQGVTAVSISINGTQQTHDLLSGRAGSFREAMEGVKQVISAGIDLACTMTLNSQNYSDIKQVMHILAQAGVPQLTLTRFIPTGQGRLHPEMQITQKQLQSVLNLCWKMYHKESALPAISWGMPVPVCNLHSKVISLKIKPCCYGIDHFYVSPAGDLMHCGLLRQPLGNLFEMTFEEICTQSPLLNMLNKLNHLPPKCKTCEHLSRCGGGCRAMAYDNYSQYVELEPDGIPILAKEED